ncbi:hypothetical protein DAEQUDRAFT_551210 [Daedalea quercina L-15889]|uniref:Uncharacterized protein n=1 Tax=Daedalea quercina L-15889 TaxID=1314783 RepID=A0A165T3D6_9APHY|nr:hypothetical protein DAEQUDRAFT_551210 [Daedalea quercina L-15889]
MTCYCQRRYWIQVNNTGCDLAVGLINACPCASQLVHEEQSITARARADRLCNEVEERVAAVGKTGRNPYPRLIYVTSTTRMTVFRRWDG